MHAGHQSAVGVVISRLLRSMQANKVLYCRGRHLWGVEVHAGHQSAVGVAVSRLLKSMQANKVL